jgi:hypothetical protein
VRLGGLIKHLVVLEKNKCSYIIINMRNALLITAVVIIGTFCFSTKGHAATPESAYIFAYSTMENGGRIGLHFAWSVEREHWHAIGPEHSFLKSDYGTWGGQKRMYDPFLMKDSEGV